MLSNLAYSIYFLEVQEEVYDSRSLYDRLKEQKDKKDYDFEEAHKLSIYDFVIMYNSDTQYSHLCFRKFNSRPR